MENYTNLRNVQQFYPRLIDLSLNAHFPYIDFPSLPSPNSLQDLNSFTADTHQIIFDSTLSGGIFFSEKDVDQQDVIFNSHLNQYSSNNNWNEQDENYVHVNTDNPFSYINNSQGYSIGEQSSSSIYPASNMATETHVIAAPIDSGNTTGYRPELRCLVPECSPDRKFPSESALRKHEARHSKPYICQVPNCKHTRFGDKAGLDRHNREVHGSQTYRCPITSCKRHARGFPRKYNLFEHQKRCHSSQSPNLAPPSIFRQQTHISDNMNGQKESYESESSSKMVTGGGERLREKLENLYKMRAEIEMDIETLERSLDLLGEDSP